VKVFDVDKTRMIGLPCSEKNYDNMLSRFHPIPERHGQTDGRTDGRTDRITISISCVRVLTRDRPKTLKGDEFATANIVDMFLRRYTLATKLNSTRSTLLNV